MFIRTNRRKLLWVLSSAIDLVGVTDISHGKRVAYIAEQIRKRLPDFPWTQNDVITAGLLHDCGVSSTDIHEHLILEMEWSHAQEHCKRGELLLLNQPAYRHLAKSIGLHHTRWYSMADSDSELLGNLLFLADRIDVLAATSTADILIARDEILQTISTLSPSLFSPEFVFIFSELAQREIFWLQWQEAQSEQIMQDWLNDEPECEMSFEELRNMIRLFSSCVDGKSNFTYNHSVGVAAIAVKIAHLMHISEEDTQKIELAALLHDIGKLRVPDDILEKPSDLDKSETQIMRHHSYDTFRILSQIPGIQGVIEWASQHHEKLNGSGYPEGLYEHEIPIQSRIVSIADIFQALAQDRPYRKGLQLEEILKIMNQMTERHELDSSIFETVQKHGDLIYEATHFIPEDSVTNV